MSSGAELRQGTRICAAPEPVVPVDQSIRIAAVPRAASAESPASQSQQPESQRLLNDLQVSNALAQAAMTLDQMQQGRARNVPDQQALRSNVEYQQRLEANVQSKLLGKFARAQDNRSQQSTATGEDERPGGVTAVNVPPAAEPLPIEDALRDTAVRTDVSAVEQIVANLMDNACKYSAGGEDRRIHVHIQADARWLRLRVTDHGPGVAADVVRRLARPFCRSAQEAANSAPGVGLGLALSRRLARQSGGDLTLVPNAAAGACFELKLPVR